MVAVLATVLMVVDAFGNRNQVIGFAMVGLSQVLVWCSRNSLLMRGGVGLSYAVLWYRISGQTSGIHVVGYSILGTVVSYYAFEQVVILFGGFVGFATSLAVAPMGAAWTPYAVVGCAAAAQRSSALVLKLMRWVVAILLFVVGWELGVGLGPRVNGAATFGMVSVAVGRKSVAKLVRRALSR